MKEMNITFISQFIIINEYSSLIIINEWNEYSIHFTRVACSDLQICNLYMNRGCCIINLLKLLH